MKKLLVLFWSLGLCLCHPDAWAQQYTEQQNLSHPQYLKNAGFENKTAQWTVAAGTKTYPTAIGDKISGRGFKLAFTSVAAGTTLLSQTYSDCADLNGKNLLAGIHIKTPSANIEVCSQVDGTDQQCVAVPSGGTKLEWVPVTMVAGPFTCGMRVKVVNSTTTSDITVDAARLGENTNSNSASIQTAPLSFTPTGSHTTNVSYTGWYSRNGSFLTQETTLTYSGANTQGALTINLPPGLTIDPSVSTGIFDTVIGDGQYRIPAVESVMLVVLTNNSTSVRITFPNVNTSDAGVASDSVKYNSVDTSAGIPKTVASTHFIKVKFTVPILGWAASNVVEYPAANILGTVFMEPSSSTCRPGSVKLDGSTLSGSQYSALIAYNGTSVLKNWNALHPRGTGTQSVNGRTKTGPSLGAIQEDSFQGHYHNPLSPANSFATGASITPRLTDGAANYNGYVSTTGNPTTGTNGAARFGDETRGNSIGVTWCQWYVSQASQLIKQSVVYDTVVKAEGMNGVTSIADGTYTPTVSNVSNTSARSISTIRFKREGKNVRVWGILVATCVAGSNTATEVDVSAPILPVSSALGQIGSSVIGETGLIYQDSGNFRVHWKCNSTGSVNRTFSVDYIIP